MTGTFLIFIFLAARYGQELVSFMKEKNLNPFKNILVPLAQVCMFISVLKALR
jgi:YidC/Oxa1 family membrane protein insertase